MGSADDTVPPTMRSLVEFPKFSGYNTATTFPYRDEKAGEIRQLMTPPSKQLLLEATQH